MSEKCRRCSECQNEEHHWLDNVDFVEENDPEYVCKHCPAVGMTCDYCDDGLSKTRQRCGICQGSGILKVGTEETESQLTN